MTSASNVALEDRLPSLAIRQPTVQILDRTRCMFVSGMGWVCGSLFTVSAHIYHLARDVPPSATVATSHQQTSLSQAEVPSIPKAPKVSKFKLALAQTRDQAGPSSPGQATPVSIVERSSPKATTPESRTPVAVPSSSARISQAYDAIPTHLASGAPPAPVRAPGRKQVPGMVIDSPSFRPPTASRSSTSSPLRSVPIVSPRQLSPQSATTAIDSPSFQSVVLSSPSLPVPPSSQTPAPAPSTDRNLSETPVPGLEETVPERPSVVMAAEVKESSGIRGGSAPPRKERKVSRFLAERT